MGCTECGSESFEVDKENAEMTCRKCGLVSDYVEQARVNTAIMSTMQAGTYKNGRIVNAASLLSYKEKNLAEVSWLLNILESQLKLPNNIAQDALYLYKQLLEKNLIIGRDVEELLCACIYISCKKRHYKLSLTDFEKCIEIKSNRIKRACKFIINDLNIKIPYNKIEDILNYVFFKINFPNEKKGHILELLEKIKDSRLIVGKKPRSVLAGILYFASVKDNLLITQQKICGALDNRPKTLRKYYKVVQCVQRNTKIK